MALESRLDVIVTCAVSWDPVSARPLLRGETCPCLLFDFLLFFLPQHAAWFQAHERP